MKYKKSVIKKCLLVFVLMFILSSCAITNKGIMRQNIVSKNEIELMSYFREGMYYFNNSKYLDAAKSFEKALYINDNPKIRYNLSLALERLGDTDKALAIITNLYHNNKEDINYKMGQARMLDLVGKKDEAIYVYNEILDDLKSKSDVKDYRYKVYRRLSDLYFKVGDTQEAICYSQMAYNEKKVKDELLRHARLLLSLNVPMKDIYSYVQSESKVVKKIILENKNAKVDKFNSIENLEQDELNFDYQIDENNSIGDDCRLESIFAFAFLDDFKQNRETLLEIIARSKECLNKKDPYYQVLAVLENIALKYNLEFENKGNLEAEDSSDVSSVTDATLLSLPGSAYKYLARFFPEYNISKNE